MAVVKRENFKRCGYRISNKPYFMSLKAFVQCNLALNSLNAKLLFTEKNESIVLSPSEVNSLILMGITYASKDDKLKSLREFLIQKTKEAGKPAVWYLMGKDGASNYFKKLGYEGELEDEKLLESALAELKGKEPTFIPAVTTPVEEMFTTAAVATLSSPYAEDEVEYFAEQVKGYVESIKKKKGNDLTEDELRELYKVGERAIAYRIQRKTEFLKEILQGKNILETVTPNDFSDEIEVFRKREAMFNVIETVLLAYDPDFTRDKATYRFLYDEIKEVYEKENPDLLADFLVSTITYVEQFPETKDVLAYNLLALAGFGRTYSIHPLKSEAFMEELEQKEAENGVDLFVKKLEELGEVHPSLAVVVGEKALKVAEMLLDDESGFVNITEREIEKLEAAVEDLKKKAKETEKKYDGKEKEVGEVITDNELEGIEL